MPETPNVQAIARIDESNVHEVEQAQAQTVDAFSSLSAFEQAQRMAALLAKSTIVPKLYQGDIANCVVALNMASLMQTNPLLVMQHLYIVNGKPGWSTAFLQAHFNTCGQFTRIRYEKFGEPGTPERGCRAVSSIRETGEVIQSIDVTMAMAQQEGWVAKSGSKWQTMPEQMLAYRAAMFLIRAYAPELGMGMSMIEEEM